ncbi:MAG: hypothetical protein ACRDQZ_08125 [Mycobacteriales bacterium]
MRAREIENTLDAAAVPVTHASIYRGASVGWATCQPGETSAQVLGHASEVMRARKEARKQRPS